MVISVIICTHGRTEDLASTLASMLDVKVPSGCSSELLVIENGAANGAEALVANFKHPEITAHYIYHSVQGKSRALNLGIKAARGDILVFTDDDIRFTPEWLNALCRPILDGKAMASVGRILVPAHLHRPWMKRYHLGWLGVIGYSNHATPDEAAGANWACHRNAIDKVSGFDVELGGGAMGNCEDTLISRQIIAAGFPIAMATGAEIEHHFQTSKLLYINWVRAAQAAGRSRAYLLYHWFHEDIPFAFIRCWYIQTKLNIRRAFYVSRQPTDEGIPAWELSYLEELAKCRQFMLELRYPRKYARKGLIKLFGEQAP